MIFDKGAKTIQWKRQSFQQMALGKLDIHMQKNEGGPLPNTIYTKVNSKWIQDLKVRPKTLKLLEENIGQNIPDIGFGNGFFDMTPKAQVTKEKNTYWT